MVGPRDLKSPVQGPRFAGATRRSALGLLLGTQQLITHYVCSQMHYRISGLTFRAPNTLLRPTNQTTTFIPTPNTYSNNPLTL